jgi:hypothetical membrane protein
VTVFDFTLHAASLLTAGAYGWIQVVTFIVNGAMVVVAAIGMHRAMRTARERTWGPLLLGVHGVGMVVAGIFRADPAYGFPVGTRTGRAR